MVLALNGVLRDELFFPQILFVLGSELCPHEFTWTGTVPPTHSGISWEKSSWRPQLPGESLHTRHLNCSSDDALQCQPLDHVNVRYPGFDWKMSALRPASEFCFFFIVDNLRALEGLNHFKFSFILLLWCDTTSLHSVAALFLRHFYKPL